MAERKPFHETIIGSIQSATTHSEMLIIADQLVRTTIPKNHDAIIAAWSQQLRCVGTMCDVFRNAFDSLFEQEREAKAAALTKQQGQQELADHGLDLGRLDELSHRMQEPREPFDPSNP